MMKQITLTAGIFFFVFRGYLSAQNVTDNQKDIHTMEGVNLYNAHKYKESITEFTKAIKEDPKNGKAFYYRGMAKMHDGQKGFCKDLEESLKLDYSTTADIYYYGCDTHVKK